MKSCSEISGRRSSIVFLARYPVASRHRDAWGFDRLVAQGFDVVVLDLHVLLAPRVSFPDRGVDIGSVGIVLVRSFGELDELVKEFAGHSVFMDYVVGLADADVRGARVLRILKRHSALFYEMAAGDVPHPSQFEGVVGRRLLMMTRLRKALDPGHLLGYITRKSILFATRSAGLVPLPNRIFGTRSQTVMRYFDRLRAPRGLFVPVNAPDYDGFREAVLTEDVSGTADTCVFVDMAMTSHPDIATLGLPSVDAERYTQAMRRLFEGIERDTGMRVLVAAHPQATYADGAFGGRPIRRGCTASLVASSRCVITHASTAVGYAVLWRKPIIFVVTDDMIRAGYHLDVMAMADALLLPVRNADSWIPDSRADDYLAMEDASYAAYEEEYLVSPESRDRSSWEIVAEYARHDLAARSDRMAGLA